MNNKEKWHEYYLKNKERILQRNKEWREANKDKFRELLYKNRRKKAKALKEQGIKYNWRSNAERERLYKKHYERIDKRIEEEKNIINDEQQERNNNN